MGKAITYLAYCAGGKCKDTHAPLRDEDGQPIKQPKTFKQFWVIEELRRMGVTAWCGRRIDFVRTGKNRYAEAHESPFLPNYLFIEMTAEQFMSVTGVKFLAPTFQVVPRREVIGGDGRIGLDTFKKLIEADYSAAQRVDANSKAAVAEYKEGQQIRAISGPFADMDIWFSRIVQKGHDSWPRVEGMVDMFGRQTAVLFDPLDVKAAR